MRPLRSGLLSLVVPIVNLSFAMSIALAQPVYRDPLPLPHPSPEAERQMNSLEMIICSGIGPPTGIVAPLYPSDLYDEIKRRCFEAAFGPGHRIGQPVHRNNPAEFLAIAELVRHMAHEESESAALDHAAKAAADAETARKQDLDRQIEDLMVEFGVRVPGE